MILNHNPEPLKMIFVMNGALIEVMYSNTHKSIPDFDFRFEDLQGGGIYELTPTKDESNRKK